MCSVQIRFESGMILEGIKNAPTRSLDCPIEIITLCCFYLNRRGYLRVSEVKEYIQTETEFKKRLLFNLFENKKSMFRRYDKSLNKMTIYTEQLFTLT